MADEEGVRWKRIIADLLSFVLKMAINARITTPIELTGFTTLFSNSYFVLYFFRNDGTSFATITKRII